MGELNGGDEEFRSSPSLGTTGNSATSSPASSSSPRKERQWKIQALTGKGIVKLPESGSADTMDNGGDSTHLTNDSNGNSDNRKTGANEFEAGGNQAMQRNDWKVKALTGRGLLSCDDLEKAKKKVEKESRSNSAPKDLGGVGKLTTGNSGTSPRHTTKQLEVVSPRSPSDKSLVYFLND